MLWKAVPTSSLTRAIISLSGTLRRPNVSNIFPPASYHRFFDPFHFTWTRFTCCQLQEEQQKRCQLHSLHFKSNPTFPISSHSRSSRYFSLEMCIHSRCALMATFSFALLKLRFVGGTHHLRSKHSKSTIKIEMKPKRGAIISFTLSHFFHYHRVFFGVVWFACNFSATIEAIFSSTSLDPFKCRLSTDGKLAKHYFVFLFSLSLPYRATQPPEQDFSSPTN